MRKTKSIVWLAAAALAAVLAIVAGCKHDDEDDWTPLTIRNAVLEKYAGERTTLTVPDGVTGIGSRAFSGSDVTAVVIPSEVTSIAADAFDGSKVKSVSFVALQEDWNGRPEYGLQGDIKAAYFIIDKNGMLTGYEGDETEVVIPAGFVKGIADKDIGDGVFGGRGITVVTIPGSVRRVGTHAFAGCTALKDVRIEAGVADIGAFAFARCTGLAAATIPAGARRLGGGIFNGCTELTGLSVHESVTEIAPGALAGTERLEAITYTGRKAQWEKLVVGKERDFAGKRVYCQDGEDWWYGPERDTGDDPAHTHDFKYDFLDKDSHKKGCKLCDYAETEAHVYDDEDVKCTVCGYRKAKPGNSECVHDWDMKSDTDGHYQECTHCGGIRNSENHTWGSYENDGAGGHKKTCTARCGYFEPVSHTWSTTYTTDANKHYKTCMISGCIAHDEEDAHDYNGAPYQDDGNGKHYQICKVCKHQSAPVDHNYADAPYTDDKNGGHYQTCTADGCNARTAPPTPHNFKYKKIDDDTHLVTCEQCSYFTNESHNITRHEPKDDNQHYEICEMCEASMLVVHEYEYTDIKDDSHTKTCKICNHLFVEEHHYDDDADTVCNGCGYKRPLPPGDLKIEGGTLTIGKNGEVTEYKTDSSQDTPVNVSIPEGVTGIKDGVFSKIWNLGTVTVPGSVESIGASAFADSGIQNVTLNGVKDIGDNAFNGCYRLVDVAIADGVETIGSGAFQSCGKLETVAIPGSVTSIGGNAFKDCKGLTSVTIADGVTSIGSGAFAGCDNEGFTSITIPGSVTAIGNGAFQNCGGLTEAVIENGVKEIAVDMFEGCHKLESIKIPQSVDAIGSGAFKNCSSLKEVNSLDGVKSIGDRAFQGCHGFKSITIPDSVTSIGDNAFDGCTGIIEMTISKNVTSIGMDALACGNLTTITYTGTLADWLTLFSSSGIKSGVTVNCSNGTIKTP